MNCYCIDYTIDPYNSLEVEDPQMGKGKWKRTKAVPRDAVGFARHLKIVEFSATHQTHAI